jgi:hypothetical protein
MKRIKLLGLMLINLSLWISCVANNDEYRIDLSGEWQVTLDSLDIGITRAIHLPGTLCDAGYGTPCTLKPEMEKEVFRNLKRKYDYTGVAWYSKEIEIPSGQENKDFILSLERVIWDSQVWIDGEKLKAENESLVAPHYFTLPGLKAGKHQLTIRIDNRKKYNIGREDMAHAYTNETQTMWNGILGDISLQAKDKIRIGQINIYPDVDHSKIRVKIMLLNTSGKSLPKTELSFYVTDNKGNKLKTIRKELSETTITFDYKIEKPELWSEFNPAVYTATASLKTGKYENSKSTSFGMRELTNNNALLQVNGKRLFLRGTLECCIFPLKGYPPTDTKDWEKIFTTAKSYGLNHIRFHSWCPPEAAFIAADKSGIYLQIELPFWSLTVGADPKMMQFIYNESDKIIEEYGNHPSFCFWSLGNELQGDFTVMNKLLRTLKEKDSRRLYTTTTYTFEKGHGDWPEPDDDFWISQRSKKGWLRGQGIFDSQPANFDKDYSAAIDSLNVPLISHEIGQYSVYPDLEEIEKYTGNLIPLNFMAIKNDLEKKGRLNKANNYLYASGKLAAILYKEEIERALKTAGFSGFQLLDLHDFPGQGTALVGLLNAFWESKGVIEAEEFRHFCSPVVPLLRFEKATYSNADTFEAGIEIANFSGNVLKNPVIEWQIMDGKGNIFSEGNRQLPDIPIGNAVKQARISFPLTAVSEAVQLTVNLNIKNTEYRNSWNIWVYPRNLEINTGNVVYTQNPEEAKKLLAQGKTVLLNPEINKINGLEGKFVPVFWSPIHFPNQPGTMGILCDPKHPALQYFPTEMHGNWQWWEICKKARTMDLDALGEIEPIVSQVDNFYKNRNLGLIFEAKCGNGKLLVCSSDLCTDIDARPVAKQLKYSLIKYMNSGEFNPVKTMSIESIIYYN